MTKRQFVSWEDADILAYIATGTHNMFTSRSILSIGGKESSRR